MKPAVGGAVVADERVQRRRRVRGRGGLGHPGQLGHADRRAEPPHAGREQGDVDDGGLAGLHPVEQRRGDAAGDDHGAERVAERRTRRAGQVVGPGHLHGRGDAGAHPEPQEVVAAEVLVRSQRAVARAARVDDVRVGRADVVDVHLELAGDGRQLVGEEHVRRRREPVQDLAPGIGRQVQAEALLPAVGVLHEHVHPAAADVQPTHVAQTALRVAPLDVLDLDDRGTPVREDAGRQRCERVLGDLEDAHAAHDRGHRVPRSSRPRPSTSMDPSPISRASSRVDPHLARTRFCVGRILTQEPNGGLREERS